MCPSEVVSKDNVAAILDSAIYKGGGLLVGLRYFGPDVHKNVPNVGDYKK